jgi:hypothetical protein
VTTDDERIAYLRDSVTGQVHLGLLGGPNVSAPCRPHVVGRLVEITEDELADVDEERLCVTDFPRAPQSSAESRHEDLLWSGVAPA